MRFTIIAPESQALGKFLTMQIPRPYPQSEDSESLERCGPGICIFHKPPSLTSFSISDFVVLRNLGIKTHRFIMTLR